MGARGREGGREMEIIESRLQGKKINLIIDNSVQRQKEKSVSHH